MKNAPEKKNKKDKLKKVWRFEEFLKKELRCWFHAK